MTFATRRDAVLEEIAAACARHRRDSSEVELLAVSKTRPAAAVVDALATGQRAFGESRVQELVAKSREIESPIRWHMIGSVQTNKIGALLSVGGLELVHSVDRERLAHALERRLADDGRPPLDVLLQIEATGEAQKHGVRVEDARGVVEAMLRDCPHLRLRGLMAIGPGEGDPALVFARVADLLRAIETEFELELPTLSLGMSGDLDAAIAAGSTLVRVGTALFGARS